MPSFHSVVRLGSGGTQVSQLQQRLARAGFNPGPIDADFGALTRRAVEQFQARHGLTVDGVVGPKTWAALNNLPGSSDEFRAHVPSTDATTPAPASTTGEAWREGVVAEARRHLGLHETGTNGNPFSRYFGRGAEKWCADFVSYVYTRNGHALNESYTPSLLGQLRSNGTFNRWNPQAGDIVMFDWDRNRGPSAQHTGLVERVFSSNGQLYVQTIEGNTDDAVKRKTYPLSSASIVGFGHV